MQVFIIVPRGIGEQDPAGVFLDKYEAFAAARRLWKASDGYHELVVQEREVGVVYDSYPRGTGSWRKDYAPTTDKPFIQLFESEPKRFEG